jgi:hypothetical protein
MAKQLLGKEVTAALNERLQAQVAELKENGRYAHSRHSSCR